MSNDRIDEARRLIQALSDSRRQNAHPDPHNAELSEILLCEQRAYAQAAAEFSRPYRERIAELEKRLAETTAPLTVDGKTPGQVDYEGYTMARFGANTNGCTPWDRLGSDFHRFNEAGAQAVLRAFGNSPPRQTAQTNAAEALRRVRERINGNLEGGAAEYAIDIIDNEIAKLEMKPAPDHVHELGSCSFCDKLPTGQEFVKAIEKHLEPLGFALKRPDIIHWGVIDGIVEELFEQWRAEASVK